LVATALAIGSVGRQSAASAQTPASGSAETAALRAAQPAPLSPTDLETKIDELLAAHAAVNGFSGAVLVASAGRPIFAKGVGYANREWQIPNTTTTKFRIGSITKQFTSMLVMQLREQGKVRVEDSICSYLAPCPDAWKPVTIHHLLTHTSGIKNFTDLPAWMPTMMMPRTHEQMVALFRDLPLEWTPGENYGYSNSGYLLLGLVIEKITGKKYEMVLQSSILTPVGMSDTGYDRSGTVVSRRASGYTGQGNAVVNARPVDMEQTFGAGSLYSTVEDLLKWDQVLYTEKLLPQPAKTLMWTPFKEGYAYGWILPPPTSTDPFGSHSRMVHAGGINGFSSFIVRVPDANVTFIVLSNNDSANASNIGRDIGSIYYGRPYTIPSVPR